MSAFDWLVFAVYFGAVVTFAWHQSRRNRGVEGFFLANRRMGWGAIGLSVMAYAGERDHVYRDHRPGVR